ncbi:acyl-CoA dehydrogenase family protein [Sphaerisporangium sp. TRM90804]|uniref:acyl-CoA dehydrogenase family protein n=1 Tax=Sphaerisporangium sp. TRM90804 TaxID=3031113 RepID=UPI002446F80E|nr:acyl-CoA dehydrogenase family protein [Sphaerisporangium sp. TRM90804]MDH2424502.1 acyl-CoA dehydrogenase family protein [Sphaerisporangium sp. TRM90804]
MSVATNVPEYAVVSPPEPGLTPAEIVARAEAIAPTLVARQAETEQRTFYAEDTHEEFRRAGFYRILVPRRYGGYEFGIDTFMRVTMALTRGCPSTGWMYCLGSAHALIVASLFDDETQAELFASGEFICPATVAPSGTNERTPEGDYVLSGTWNYCSGSPYATHFLGHTLVSHEEGQPPEPVMFVAPRSEWSRLSDWGGQLGLKGSGSHSITMDGARVPARYTLNTHVSQVSVTEGTLGREIHGNPEYGGGQLSFMVIEDAALAVGMARCALDAYEELMRTRSTLFPPQVPRAEDADYQYWYGEAASMIGTGEAAVLNAIQQWIDICTEGAHAVTNEQEMRLASICHQVVNLCWHAVENYLFPTAGSSAVRQGQRIERVWRDMSMFHSHAGFAVFLSTIAKRQYAKARFGIQDAPH